jgi:aldehyde dehydrogenase (NAD+)
MPFTTPDISILPSTIAVVGDQLLTEGSGVKHSHIYPANGSITVELQLAGPDEVDNAVVAARAAFPSWRNLSGDARRNLMLKLADLIEAEAAYLSSLEVIGNGAPSMMSAYTPVVVAQRFRYYAGWADKIQGDTLDAWNGPAHNYVSYEPYGVIGAIVPWNGPLFAAAMVVAPLLAAGNCAVLKAPELSPFSVMRLGELFLEAGFPPGVVNTVAGGSELGEAIVTHPGIDKIQFVGSGATAKKVLKGAADTLKPCGLELGGKSAVIVFADADIADAAKRGLSGAMSVSGQGCVNGTRILVERPIYEAYLGAMQAIVPHIKVGDPQSPETVMGPVITPQSLDRILGMIHRATEQGARLITGGARLAGDCNEGFFLPITILADVDPSSEIAQHEVFGPVLTVTPFDTEDEAIALSNDSDYGLGAYIHTQNLRRAHQVASQMQAGMVQVNASGEGMQPFAPFGGFKQSGYGRLGGKQGLFEFLQTRNVWMNLKKGEQ